jgi:hypothetical protein
VVHERASGKHGHEFFSQISMVMMVMKVPKADMVINVPNCEFVASKHGSQRAGGKHEKYVNFP